MIKKHKFMEIDVVADDRIIESSPGSYVTYASVLGFERGVWPLKIETDLGNDQPLVQAKSSWDGRILYVTYTQVDGSITLKVINDD